MLPRSSSYHACKVLQSSARQLAKDVGCSTQENLNSNVNVMHAARFLRTEKATPLLILREAFVYVLFKGIAMLGKLKCLRVCVIVCVFACVLVCLVCLVCVVCLVCLVCSVFLV
jgi:hypothetical protein